MAAVQDKGQAGVCVDAGLDEVRVDENLKAALGGENTGRFINAAPGSLLVDWQIKELCSAGKLISSGYYEENVESVSYNLTIMEIIGWKLKEMPKIPVQGKKNVEITRQSCLHLAPGEMVFVRMAERLQIPDNVVGRIVERNSLMRLGLMVSGPQYQPGHTTAIFLRVCNLSGYDIVLKEGDSIAQICFEVLNQIPQTRYGEDNKSDPCQGEKRFPYQDEKKFVIPLDYIQEHVTEPSDLQKKMDHLEARIYTVVAAFIGAFVSVLSLLVLNFNALADKSIEEIVVLNLSLAACITIILGIVFLFCKSMTRL